MALTDFPALTVFTDVTKRIPSLSQPRHDPSDRQVPAWTEKFWHHSLWRYRYIFISYAIKIPYRAGVLSQAKILLVYTVAI
jgi:hypothetical protein